MDALPIVRVCLGCRPGVTDLPGARVSHGYCRRHELVELARYDLLAPIEALELNARKRAAVLQGAR